jgi:L-lysine 2,3-aminomutase
MLSCLQESLSKYINDSFDILKTHINTTAKKNVTPFSMFKKEKYAKLKNDKRSLNEKSKEISKMWKSLSTVEQKPYEQLAVNYKPVDIVITKKRKPNVYHIFCKEKKREQESHPDKPKLDSIQLSEMWKKMSASDKQPFEKIVQKMMEEADDD